MTNQKTAQEMENEKAKIDTQVNTKPEEKKGKEPKVKFGTRFKNGLETTISWLETNNRYLDIGLYGIMGGSSIMLVGMLFAVAIGVVTPFMLMLISIGAWVALAALLFTIICLCAIETRKIIKNLRAKRVKVTEDSFKKEAEKLLNTPDTAESVA